MKERGNISRIGRVGVGHSKTENGTSSCLGFGKLSQQSGEVWKRGVVGILFLNLFLFVCPFNYRPQSPTRVISYCHTLPCVTLRDLWPLFVGRSVF